MTKRKAKPLTYEQAQKLHAEMRHNVRMSLTYLRGIKQRLVETEKIIGESETALEAIQQLSKGNKAA